LADFDEHVQRATDNLELFQEFNSTKPQEKKWQVTFLFYSALHLMQAHLVRCNNYAIHHSERKEKLFFGNSREFGGLEEEVYEAYIHLEKLSRRDRYMSHGTAKNAVDALNQPAAIMKHKHILQAVRDWNVVCAFFHKRYGIQMKCIKVNCLSAKKDEDLGYVKIRRPVEM